MKFTCHKAPLASALSAVAPLARPNAPAESLKGIKFFGRDSDLVLTACDGEMFASAKVGLAEPVEWDGALMPADVLVPLVGGFPADEITFDCGDSQATLKGGRASYKVPLLKMEAFPEVAVIIGNIVASVPCSDLRRWIGCAKAATGGKDWRDALLIRINGASLVMCGSNGNNAHMVNADITDLGADEELTVAAAHAARLEQMLPDASDIEVKIIREQNAVAFVWSMAAARLPMMAIKYPRIPEQISGLALGSAVKVDSKALSQALTRLLRATSEKTYFPAVTIKPGEMLSLSSVGPYGIRSGEEMIPAECNGAEWSSSTNTQSIIDALRCLSGGNAELRVDEKTKILGIKSTDNSEFIAALSPLQKDVAAKETDHGKEENP